MLRAPADPTGSMMTTTEALKLIRSRTGLTISRDTFYRWMASGRIPTIQLTVGGWIYVNRAVLDAWIARFIKGEI